MTNRFRTVAALLALLALSVTVAERAWASACLPAGAGAEASMPAGTHGPAGGAHHGDPAQSGTPDAPAQPAPTGSGCPFQALATGCTVAVLPAGTLTPPPADRAPSLAPPAPDRLSHLLLASGLFRPPQR